MLIEFAFLIALILLNFIFQISLISSDTPFQMPLKTSHQIAVSLAVFRFCSKKYSTESWKINSIWCSNESSLSRIQNIPRMNVNSDLALNGFKLQISCYQKAPQICVIQFAEPSAISSNLECNLVSRWTNNFIQVNSIYRHQCSRNCRKSSYIPCTGQFLRA